MYKKSLILATVITAALTSSVTSAKAESSGFLYWGTGSPYYKNAPDTRNVGRYVRVVSNDFTVEEKAIIRTAFNEMFGRDRHDKHSRYDDRYGHHSNYYDRDDYGHGHDHHYKNKSKKDVSYRYSKQDHAARDLERYIAKTGYLPRGVKQRDLPYQVQRRLPKRDRSQDIVWIDNDIYLVDARTHAVLDVIRNVSR